MRGLTIVAATGDVERFRAALSLACAHAALGGAARLYCHEAAATLLVPGADADDALRAEAGLASRAQLLDEALAIGVTLIGCQTGLAAAGIAFDTLSAGVEPGGLVSLLAGLGGDRLVTL
ncbi:peroxiredoxin [Sphingomonas sp. MS122]|uniref:peroxiredoxin n=1 Tax=Sphingomonas sp. MS122 TaxID=3412683 RepID=UPI003C2C70F1